MAEERVERRFAAILAADVGGYLRDLFNYHDEIDDPFPEPWIEAGDKDGYRIEPIKTADDLCYEGERMHHCVANYVGDVASGKAYFYHVSKDGERVATMQLTQTANRYVIEEIRGICNADVSSEVLTAVRRWIARPKTAAVTSGIVKGCRTPAVTRCCSEDGWQVSDNPSQHRKQVRREQMS